MSMFYRVAYWVGFTPWEGGLAQGPVVEQISAMFDREEIGRQPPYGSALDLGCGSGIHAVKLAVRGWQVTGVDNVSRVLRAAHERARKAGVTVRFIEGDVTGLRGLNLGSGVPAVAGLRDRPRPEPGTARGGGPRGERPCRRRRHLADAGIRTQTQRAAAAWYEPRRY